MMMRMKLMKSEDHGIYIYIYDANIMGINGTQLLYEWYMMEI
jgi:hypothetical protein